MPELPEVETVCRTIHPLLCGRSIAGVELTWPRTLAMIDPATLQRSIFGKTIVDVTRRAKLIILMLDDGSAVSVHLRMTGELLISAAGTVPDPSREKYLRASFALDDRSVLDFYDVRKFGRISYLTPDLLQAVDAAYGIEPLTPAFTGAALHSLLTSRAKAAKSFLLDQTLIAGLGNIYVDEALFKAGIHPLTRSNEISPERANLLRDAIVEILANSIARHGTTLRDYRSGLGAEGGFRPHLRIYGFKAGQPCTACATPVERFVIAQRGTVACPTCQPMPQRADTQHRSVAQPPDHLG